MDCDETYSVVSQVFSDRNIYPNFVYFQLKWQLKLDPIPSARM